MLKKSVLNKIFLGLLLLVILLLAGIGSQHIVNLIFLLICPLLLVQNRKLLYLIYVILLPTNGFISTEYNLFGVFHVLYIVNLFATIGVLREWNSFTKQERRTLPKIGDLEKCAYYLTLFVFLYLLLSEYRFYFLGASGISPQLLITRSVRYFAMFIPMLFLIRLSALEEYKQIIRTGFLISIGLVAVSIIFSDQLLKIGIDTIGYHSKANVFDVEINRRAGVYFSLGDFNSAGGFLAVGFAFILFIADRYIPKIRKILLLTVIILAVVATGSRTALFELLAIIVLYVLSGPTNSKEKLILVSMLALFSIYLFSQGYVDAILARFKILEAGTGHLDKYFTHGRLGGWILYLEYIFSNFEVLLCGSTESVYKFEGAALLDERVAHNYYIQLVYLWGIFPFLILLHVIFKFLITSLHSQSKYVLVALFIPFLLTSNTVSDTGIFVCFLTAIAAFPYLRV